MASGKAYRSALLKLSGNAFADQNGRGISEGHVEFICRQIAEGYGVCSQLAVVVGGGNILRGAVFRPEGHERLRADYAGMIATMVNALVLQDGLERAGVRAAVYGPWPVAGVVRPFAEEPCRAELQSGRVVILSGGTGNPLFTTDTGAALRAVQLGAEIMLKATRVEGVYSGDPEKDSKAQLYERLNYDEVLARRLGVMDMCAVSLCRDHALPVRVFNYRTEGNIRRVLAGEQIGTLLGT